MSRPNTVTEPPQNRPEELYERVLHDILGAGASSPERSRLVRYFEQVVSAYSVDDPPAVIMITHVLPERPVFLSAVAAVSDLVTLIPKPRSVDPLTLTRVSDAIPVRQLSRSDCGHPDRLLAHLEACAAGRDLVLFDIGGYFAPALRDIAGSFTGRVVGVIEDTENGHQRYEHAASDLPCPVYSVARSPLKEPEDYLVGQSIVFSVEALVRSRGDIMQGRPAVVIGFGKIGRSVAGFLRSRGVRVAVHDASAMRRAEALAHGYTVHDSLPTALTNAMLVVAATGNRSLSSAELPFLPHGAYVATVTSSDDELEPEALAGYDRAELHPQVVRYTLDDQLFYLLNDGNAVNFVHGAVVGPFIHLVQAEMLAALWLLQQRHHSPGFYEVTQAERERLAQLWMSCFDPHTPTDQPRPGATPWTTT